MSTIGTININFSIFSDSPTHLHVFDLSDWFYAENLPAYISITTPGSKKSKTFAFAKGKHNSFNSHNLGLSCLRGDCKEEEYVDLPDGIYCITVKSGFEGIETTKFYLKTDLFNIDFSKTVIQYGLDFKEEDKDFIDSMTKIKFLEGVAKSHAMLGDFAKAQRFFEDAISLLKKNSSCKN